MTTEIGIAIVRKFIAVSALVSMGCVSTVPVSELPRRECPLADAPPPSDATRRVVVAAFSVPSHSRVTAVGVMEAGESGARDMIRAAGAEMVDENLYTDEDIRKALELAEAMGEQAVDIAMATHILKGEIASIEPNARFQEEQVKMKDGRVKSRTPAQCTYQMSVEGSIDIYETTPLRIADTIYVSGAAQRVVVASRKDCPLEDRLADELAQEAVRNALLSDCGSLGIRNALAPVGYVMECRGEDADDSKNYFRISLSPAQGAERGAEAQIFAPYTAIDPKTRRRVTRYEAIVRSKVLLSEDGRSAWIRVKKKSVSDSVKAGYPVRIRYKPTFAIPGVDMCKPRA